MTEENLFIKTTAPIKGGVLLKPLIAMRGHQCECCHNTEWLGNPITLNVHHRDGDRCNNTLDNLQLLCPNCHSYTDNFGSKNQRAKRNVSDDELIIALKNNVSIRQALFSVGMSDASGNYPRIRRIINDNNIIVGSELPEELKPKKIEPEKYCKRCGKMILPQSEYCEECSHIMARTVERPLREELKQLIRTMPFTTIAAQYGVTDNAIRKWCQVEGLPRTKKEIKQYSDEEWANI